MKTFDFRGRLKDISKTTSSNSYEYSYYYETSLGDLLKYNLYNDTYGTSREGYEQFKCNKKFMDIQHSGVISLRPFTIKDSNGNIKEKGAVCETKIEADKSEQDKQYTSLEKEVWEYFCEVFNVDNPIKADLIKKIIYQYDPIIPLNKKSLIEFYLDQIFERENYSGNELDRLTTIFIDIGNLKLEV